MIGELLEIVGGLANLSVPSNRREALAMLAILSTIPIFGFGAVAFIEISQGRETLLGDFLPLPWWVRWGLPASAVIFVVCIVILAIDLRRGRELRSPLGGRPRYRI